MHLLAALLATTLALSDVNGLCQLLPFGKFEARDGRPGKGLKWEVSDVVGQQLAAQLNTIAAKTPIVIDYEHQTLRSDDNGQPAPAAGWIKSVEYRPGQGLFAKVEWTERAKAFINGGEYRYISPVIQYDPKTGVITGVLNAALVNYPALLGMQAVQARLAAQFTTTPAPTENRMDREQLIKLLGLAADATDQAITIALTALKAKADTATATPVIPAALRTELGIKDDADEATAVAAAKAIRATSATGAATAELLTSLTRQVTELSARVAGDDVEKVIAEGKAAKKVVPANEAVLRELGKKDLAALRSLLAVTLPVGESQTQDRKQDATSDTLSADEVAVCKAMGLTTEAYLKTRKEQAAA